MAEEVADSIIDMVVQIHQVILGTPPHLLSLPFARLCDILMTFTKICHKVPAVLRELERLGALEVLVCNLGEPRFLPDLTRRCDKRVVKVLRFRRTLRKRPDLRLRIFHNEILAVGFNDNARRLEPGLLLALLGPVLPRHFVKWLRTDRLMINGSEHFSASFNLTPLGMGTFD